MVTAYSASQLMREEYRIATIQDKDSLASFDSVVSLTMREVWLEKYSSSVNVVIHVRNNYGEVATLSFGRKSRVIFRNQYTYSYNCEKLAALLMAVSSEVYYRYLRSGYLPCKETELETEEA